MYTRILVLIAKLLMRLLRLTGSSGSALPGLIIEKLSPRFLSRVLKRVEKKIILVTGTNGKTTTTKMLVHCLRSDRKRVVTNSTGSNMTRGLIAALVEDMTFFGSLKQTDWFVFEMDEAYAPIFTQNLSPYVVVGLNVLRDQLDRYGEIDTTARFIGQAAARSDIFIYNGLDPLLEAQAKKAGATAVSFGVSSKLSALVANEETLHTKTKAVNNTDTFDATLSNYMQKPDGADLTVQLATGTKNKEKCTFSIPLQGFHNAINATAVIAALKQIDAVGVSRYVSYLETMEVPFGRGERLQLKNKQITVALIKNPSGFTSNLQTFVKELKPDRVLFVINDKFADGRDVSWLWDVDFKDSIPASTDIFTSGIRGFDMAVRLKHDGYSTETQLSVNKAIKQIFQSSDQNVVIIPTYTALFEVRDALSAYGKVPRIW